MTEISSVNGGNNVWNRKLAEELDAKDGKKDGKISASVWNGYLNSMGSSGNKIKNNITVDNAAKSLNFYAQTKDQGRVSWDKVMDKYSTETQSNTETPVPAEGEKPPVDSNTKPYTDAEENGQKVRKYNNGDVSVLDESGREVSGKTKDGSEYTVSYDDENNPNEGGATRTIKNKDGGTETCYYDKNGYCTDIKDSDGKTYTRTNYADGSYTDTNKQYGTFNYDKDGHCRSYKLSNGLTWVVKGNYAETTFTDGSKSYRDYSEEQNAEGDKYLHSTKNGGWKAEALQGESFEDTMTRLGITSEEDKAAFRKANPKAAARGWFKVGIADVYVPKEIAEHLDITNALVDTDAEIEKYRNRNRR